MEQFSRVFLRRTYIDQRLLFIDVFEYFITKRTYAQMEDADVDVEGGNPGCGDLITIYIKVQGDRLEKISFEGEGCTISMASASILTELVEGKSLEELQTLGHQILVDALGEESIKTRPRCATLGLDVLVAALKEYRKQQILGTLSNA